MSILLDGNLANILTTIEEDDVTLYIYPNPGENPAP
jgi:hypothetical protein